MYYWVAVKELAVVKFPSDFSVPQQQPRPRTIELADSPHGHGPVNHVLPSCFRAIHAKIFAVIMEIVYRHGGSPLLPEPKPLFRCRKPQLLVSASSGLLHLAWVYDYHKQ